MKSYMMEEAKGNESQDMSDDLIRDLSNAI